MGLFWWLRIRGTVIPAIWWQVLLLVIWAAGIACLEYFVPFLSADFPSDLININNNIHKYNIHKYNLKESVRSQEWIVSYRTATNLDLLHIY